MASFVNKVSPGQPLRIGAHDYNAFVDAANAYARGGRSGPPDPTGRFPNDHVIVRNDSGAAQSRFAILGIDDAIFDPATDLTVFQSQVALAVVTPDIDAHSGRFVVLLEPIPDGEFGRAAIGGSTFALVDVPDDGGTYAQPAAADVDDANAENLIATAGGSAAVLWRESGFGIKWGVVRLGNPGGGTGGSVFAVSLTKTGGAGGSSATKASWSYTVKDALTDETLGTGINPETSPHKWVRPSVGVMLQATYGFASYNASDDLSIGWINEVPLAEACSA